MYNVFIPVMHKKSHSFLLCVQLYEGKSFIDGEGYVCARTPGGVRVGFVEFVGWPRGRVGGDG